MLREMGDNRVTAIDAKMMSMRTKILYKYMASSRHSCRPLLFDLSWFWHLVEIFSNFKDLEFGTVSTYYCDDIIVCFNNEVLQHSIFNLGR